MPNQYIHIVDEHLQAMLEHSRTPECPLFPGVINPRTLQPSFCMLPPPGVRMNDFCWAGNNLMHDMPLLELLLKRSEISGEPRWRREAEEMITFYVRNCPHPITGLFPWGEHAQWSIPDGRILPHAFTRGINTGLETGFIIHEHLRFAPEWFWDLVWAASPDAVVRYARGLDQHIVNRRTFEHNRHGSITGNRWNDPDNPGDGPGKDFARHAGFFIFDVMYAYFRSGAEDLLEWALKKLEWHLERRLPNGIVRGCVRTPSYEKEGQHDSFTLCVADASRLAPETAIGRRLAEHAADLFAARRQQHEGQSFAFERAQLEFPWFVGYSRKGVLRGYLDCQMFAATGSDWYRQRVLTRAEAALDIPAPDGDVPVQACAFAEQMDLALSAYKLSADSRFLERAAAVADIAVQELKNGPLLCGASNLWYTGDANPSIGVGRVNYLNQPVKGMYFSGTGTPGLLRNFYRLGLILSDGKDLMDDDQHYRNH